MHRKIDWHGWSDWCVCVVDLIGERGEFTFALPIITKIFEQKALVSKLKNAKFRSLALIFLTLSSLLKSYTPRLVVAFDIKDNTSATTSPITTINTSKVCPMRVQS